MKKLLLLFLLFFGMHIQANETINSSNKSNRDSIKFALTIEKAENISADEWAQLVQVVNECIKECEESGEDTPTFLEDAKEHIKKIIEAIEKLSSFHALFQLSGNSTDVQE